MYGTFEVLYINKNYIRCLLKSIQYALLWYYLQKIWFESCDEVFRVFIHIIIVLCAIMQAKCVMSTVVQFRIYCHYIPHFENRHDIAAHIGKVKNTLKIPVVSEKIIQFGIKYLKYL